MRTCQILLRAIAATIACALLLSGAPQASTLDTQLDQLSRNLARGLAQSGKKRVAVIAFSSDDGQVRRLDRYIATSIDAGLVKFGTGLEVQARDRLDMLWNELGAKVSERFNPKTFEKFGEFTGAEVLIAGYYSVLQKRVKVTSFLYDFRGQKIGAEDVNLTVDAEVRELLTPVSPPSATLPESSRIASADPVDAMIRNRDNLKRAGQSIAHYCANLVPYQCVRSGDNAACLLRYTAACAPGKNDAGAVRVSLIDDGGIAHNATASYFVNRAGETLESVDLDKDNWVWLVKQFSDIGTSVKKIRLRAEQYGQEASGISLK